MTGSEYQLLDGALDVSRETQARLQKFSVLFDQWSRRINLVAASTTAEVWHRHVEDSAQLLLIKPEMRSLIDVGSGGGFPGIILAILLDEVKDSRVELVESNRKKTAFLQAVRSQCARRSLIHSARIEDVLASLQPPQVITARALASLDKLLALTESHLSRETIGLFHKGREFEREIEESRANWAFDLVVHDSRVERESVVLEISNLRRRDS